MITDKEIYEKFNRLLIESEKKDRLKVACEIYKKLNETKVDTVKIHGEGSDNLKLEFFRHKGGLFDGFKIAFSEVLKALHAYFHQVILDILTEDAEAEAKQPNKPKES